MLSPQTISHAPGYAEAYSRRGVPRDHYAWLLEQLEGHDLGALQQHVSAHMDAQGVTFGVAPFTICPVPRVIPAEEWRPLEQGLSQRVRALQAFLTDVYGERRIVREGVVPAQVVEGAAYFEPSLCGSGFRCPVAVAGLDVVRDEHGRYLVLEDNLRTPSGMTYAVAAREALDAHLPCPRPRLDVAAGFDMLRTALRASAPPGSGDDPFVVLLSDGPANSAWYEHRTIARRLRIPLVLRQDLQQRRDGLFANVRDIWHRVDVVYRRTDEDRLTRDDGTTTEVGRLLMEPALEGRVGVVNAFGAGVGDDKLTHAYVEDMVRFYLDQEPLLGSVPSHDVSSARTREAVLERMDEVVVKPRAESGGEGVVVGPHADDEDREAAADAVREAPEDFVAQETIWLSCVPTVVDGSLEPRHVDLRAFVFLAGDKTMVLPGGLTRVALKRGSLVVNSSQRGGGKDTWVLA